nr:MAG TPA: TMEM240 family [Caudoviricetes sp.]
MIFEISHGKQFSKISGKTPKKMSPQKSPGEKNFFLPPGVLRQQQRQCNCNCTRTDYTPAQLRHDTGSNTAVVMCATT